MNVDKSFVFNPRLSAFIGGHEFQTTFSASSECRATVLLSVHFVS